MGGYTIVILLAHRADKAVRIQSEHRNDENLPGVDLPDGVTVTASPSAVASADLVVFAVPSAHLREVATRVAPFVAPSADILSLVKGLEPGSLLRMSEVLSQALRVDARRVAALSGPNLAAEIARGLPASAVVGAEDQDLARRMPREHPGPRLVRNREPPDANGRSSSSERTT
jgi:glycerol-3-phosphate dehydrogenase (NAD(P)+)